MGGGRESKSVGSPGRGGSVKVRVAYFIRLTSIPCMRGRDRLIEPWILGYLNSCFSVPSGLLV